MYLWLHFFQLESVLWARFWLDFRLLQWYLFFLIWFPLRHCFVYSSNAVWSDLVLWSYSFRLGSNLISFQMVPMGSKTPMQHVLKLRMLEGDGNDLLVFFQDTLKDTFKQSAEWGAMSNAISSRGHCKGRVLHRLYKILIRYRLSPVATLETTGSCCQHKENLGHESKRSWALAPHRVSPAPLGMQNPCSVLLSRLLTALINFKWNWVLSTMENQALHFFKVIFWVSYLFAKQGNVSWKNVFLLAQSFR